MLPRLLSAFGVVCVGLVLLPPCRGEPPAAPDAKTIKEGRLKHTDLQGDPLPDGAIGRLGTVRFRPLGAYNSACFVAFSPDGKTLLSDGAEGLCLWDAATGARTGWFRDTFPALAARFSPDGQTLIAGDANGTIRRWQAGTGKLLGETRQERDPNFRGDVGFLSADGKTYGVASYTPGLAGPKIRLWDAATGKRILRWEQEGNLWTWAALSPDGKLLATGGKRNLVLLIDTATGREVRRLEGPDPKGEVRWFTFSPDGRSLAGSSMVGPADESMDSLCVWDVATGKLRQRIKAHRGRPTYSPDGKYLACGNDEGLHLYELAGGKEVRRFLQSDCSYQPVAFSPDGRTLAAGSRGTGVLRLWDVATGERRHRLPGHEAAVSCLAFSPDGACLASGERGGDGTLLVWDLATRKPRHAFAGHFAGVVSLAYSPDGKFLASGDGNPFGGSVGLETNIRLWDLRRGRLHREFFAHLNSVQSLAFSPDGKTLASTGGDARAKLWDVASGTRIRQIRGADGRKSATFSPDGKLLLVAGTRGELALWDPASGQKVRDLGEAENESRAVLQAAFLTDGKTIFSREFRWGNRRLGTEDLHGVYFWDAGSGRLLRSLTMGTRDSRMAISYALSPDGKTLATSSGNYKDPAIQLWDTDTGKPLTRLHGHMGGEVWALTFSPDGRFLASGGQDTTVLLWDMSHARLEHLWEELAAAEGRSAPAIKGLATKPQEAVPFLKERLHRVAEAEQRAGKLIADLDSDQFQVRERASRELEKLGPDAAFALRDALQADPSAEVRRRLQAILDKMKRPGEEAVGSDPRSVWLSLAVLEEIGTPEARQVLESLAKGPETSRIARQARVALTRLSKRRNVR